MNFKQDKLTVVKSNKLIEATYSLSLIEQRVVLFCISNINAKKHLDRDIGFIITPSDYNAIFNNNRSSKNTIAQLKSLTKSLYQRTIHYIDGPNDVELRWVQKVAHNQDDGSIELFFSTDILKYLTEIKGYFTKYKLASVSEFKSLYSVRLYELFCQWKKYGAKEFSIECLREKLEVKDKYKSMKDFKRSVIEAALKDINEFSDISAEIVSQRKTRRRITHLTFVFKETPREEQEKKKNKLSNDMIEQIRDALLAGKGVSIESLVTKESKRITQESLDTLPIAYFKGGTGSVQLNSLLMNGDFTLNIEE